MRIKRIINELKIFTNQTVEHNVTEDHTFFCDERSHCSKLEYIVQKS